FLHAFFFANERRSRFQPGHAHLQSAARRPTRLGFAASLDFMGLGAAGKEIRSGVFVGLAEWFSLQCHQSGPAVGLMAKFPSLPLVFYAEFARRTEVPIVRHEPRGARRIQ